MTTAMPPSLRVHLTNVTGTGATRLLQSLLPALEHATATSVIELLLPASGELSEYQPSFGDHHAQVHPRRLPNVLSRVLECLWPPVSWRDGTPLLVLGDLPLRTRTAQVVFVQTPHLIKPDRRSWRLQGLKYVVSRAIFQINAHHGQAFVVQTEHMRQQLQRSYPQLSGRIHVIAQPVPTWLMGSGIHRSGPGDLGAGMRLFYPAAGYPHKNHRLLSAVSNTQARQWPVARLALTLPVSDHPAPHTPWIACTGALSPQQVLSEYAQADALLFLSTEESYGFPLLEAMFIGLPVVCPDLPYAHALCGDQAIYFDPANTESLGGALQALYTRLQAGWWPNWHKQLQQFPTDWSGVAQALLALINNAGSTSAARV